MLLYIFVADAWLKFFQLLDRTGQKADKYSSWNSTWPFEASSYFASVFSLVLFYFQEFSWLRSSKFFILWLSDSNKLFWEHFLPVDREDQSFNGCWLHHTFIIVTICNFFSTNLKHTCTLCSLNTCCSATKYITLYTYVFSIM